MSEFSQNLHKRLLPSAQNFINSTEARFQEPMKRIMLIDREIATLTNPRNLSRASRSGGDGAWTQLYRSLLTLETQAAKGRTAVENKIRDKITKRNEEYQGFESEARNPGAEERRGYLLSNLIQGGQKAALDIGLPKVVGQDKDDPPTKAQLFVLADLQKDIRNFDRSQIKTAEQRTNLRNALRFVRQKTAELLKTAGVDERFRGQGIFAKSAGNEANPEEYFAKSYQDYRSEAALKTILANPKSFLFLQDTAYGKNFNMEGYKSYQDQIDWVEGVLRGRVSGAQLPGVDSTKAEQRLYIETAKPAGLTVDESSGRVVVDPDATDDKKKIAQDFLKTHTGKINPTYSEFFASRPMNEIRTGTATGRQAQAAMLKRAEELKEQKKILVQVAADTGRLTQAQKDVLNNPFFTRVGFDRQPSFRLLKRARKAREFQRPPEAAEELVQPAAQAQPEAATEAQEPLDANPGVAVLPAIQSTVNGALKDLADAMRGGDPVAVENAKDEMRRVLDGFNSLPEDLRRRLPEFVRTSLVSFEALDERSKGLSPDGLDLIRERFVLDPDQVTAVGNVADYFASRTNDPQGTRELYSVTAFLDENANRFGDLYESSIQRFEERTNQNVDRNVTGQASSFVLGDAAASAFQLLGPEVDGLTEEQFGQLQTLAEQATGMGSEAPVPDEEPAVERQPAPALVDDQPDETTPDPTAVATGRDQLDFASPRERRRIERLGRRIERERAEREAAETSRQQDLAMQAAVEAEPDDDDIDASLIAALRDPTAGADQRRQALLQQRIGQISDRFTPFQQEQRQRRLTGMNEAALAAEQLKKDQAVVADALSRIEDPLTMDLPPEPKPVQRPVQTQEQRILAGTTLTDEQIEQDRMQAQAQIAGYGTDREKKAEDERKLLSDLESAVLGGEVSMTDANRYINELVETSNFDPKRTADFQSQLNDKVLMSNTQTTRVAGP